MLIFKEVCLCIPTMVHWTPYITLPNHFTSPPFFNSFQFTSSYPLPSHLMPYYCCGVILFLFPSFPKFQRVVPLSLMCSTYVFAYDHGCFVYIFIFWICLPHMKKTCGLCVSEPGLVHLSWYPPITSIYHQTLCHYSLWLSKTQLCTYNTISWSIYQLYGICGFLWIMLWCTLVYRCLYCILTYIPLGRCPAMISLNHIAILLLAFWGISKLFSLVIILICIPTNCI
jgi:hypothetical protein